MLNFAAVGSCSLLTALGGLLPTAGSRLLDPAAVGSCSLLAALGGFLAAAVLFCVSSKLLPAGVGASAERFPGLGVI